MAPRVLVIDDLAEMRVLIRRALGTRGYDVDSAATLAEALGMDPAGYDAVLVDARLGTESGTELVEALRLRDPAAAGHCVVMTGGPADGIPEGAAFLAKPFQLDELLDAIRRVQRPAYGAGQRSLPAAVPPARPRFPDQPRPPADPMPPAGPMPPAAATPARQLLGLVRLLRGHERCGLADYLHEGAIQNLAAAFLDLQLLRRSAAPGLRPGLESALAQVDAASAALRALVDEPWPPAAGPTADGIRRRTAWLLAGPADVAVDIQGDIQGGIQADGPGGARADLVADITDITELVLLAVHPAAPAALAHIAVRAQGQPTQISVTLMPACGDRGIGDPAAAESALHGLAAALGASLRVDFFRWQWQIRLALQGVQGGRGP